MHMGSVLATSSVFVLIFIQVATHTTLLPSCPLECLCLSQTQVNLLFRLAIRKFHPLKKTIKICDRQVNARIYSGGESVQFQVFPVKTCFHSFNPLPDYYFRYHLYGLNYRQSLKCIYSRDRDRGNRSTG